MTRGSFTTSAAIGRFASGVIAFTALPFALVFVTALARAHPHLSTTQIVVYYVAPACVLLTLAVSLRRSAATRLNIALLLITLGVSAVSAEIIVTLVLQARSASSQDEGPSIEDLVREARADGIRAYPTIPGSILVDRNTTVIVGGEDVHPLAPTPARVTAVLCDEPEAITYVSDRHGFNNPDEFWDRESEVVLIGDSYTHGVCVERPSQIASLLNAEFSTLNLGARGAGPLQTLAMLREYASTRTPAAVVWTYYEGNDLYDHDREVVRPWLTDYLAGSHRQGLPEKVDEVSQVYAAWIDSLLTVGPASNGAGLNRAQETGLRLRAVLKMTSLRHLAGFGPIFPARTSPIGLIPEAFFTAQNDVDAWNGRLYLVYLPSFERYRTVIGEGMQGKREILTAAEAAGIPVIDLDPVFRATGNPRGLWEHPRGHLTEAGYRVMADAIASRLRADLPN